MFRFVAVGAIAASVVLGVPVGAQAATYYAENGSRCTKVGTSGDDSLRGTNAKDVICGRGGNDKIVGLGGDDILDGGSGNDTIYGSAGNDRMFGGTGADKLYGETGNDNLDGGEGADRLNGGTGTNSCGGSSADVFANCKADAADPVAMSFWAVTKTLDVTGGKTVTSKVRARLTDDTGIDFVVLTGEHLEWSVEPKLISGSRRDGVWEATVTARKWDTNGKVKGHLIAMDRDGNVVEASRSSIVTVLGAVPDTIAPVLTDLTLSKSNVNVTSAPGSVKVTAKLTDAYSGVAQAYACLMAPTQTGPYGYESCDLLTRSTTVSGAWSATLPIEQGGLTGDWNVAISAVDRAHQYVTYFSGEAYQREASIADPLYPVAEIPGAKGVFSVVGSLDSVPAAIDKVTVEKTTLGAQDYAILKVHATDAAGEGVQNIDVQVAGLSAGIGGGFGTYAELIDGTLTDGTWEVWLPIAGDSPSGQYQVVSLTVSDRYHRTEFTLPGNTPDAGATLLTADQVLTAGGGAWDGVITVP